MNSTATLRKTDLWLDPALVIKLRGALAALFFTILLVSFRPFNVGTSGSVGLPTGDVVNQLGFGSLGAASLFAILTLVNSRKIIALLSPWWLFLFVLAFFSAAHAIDPSSSFRALAFTLICILGMVSVLALAPDGESYQRAFLFAAITVLGLSYFGLGALPDLAKHTAFTNEPEHAGFWRGIYSHKNIAGPVMAGLSFIGIYAFRRGARLAGALVALAGLVFVANTGSKTSAGLVPLVILLVMGPGLFGFRKLGAATVFTAIAIAMLATVGTVLFASLAQINDAVAPGNTFTGRTDIWRFAMDHIAKKPLAGYGFDSFWFSPAVYFGEKDWESAWDVRGVIHGHNGYVDIALTMGLPTFVFAVFAMLIVPMADYAKCIRSRENVLLADLFMMIFTFSALNACLESFFFRRSDPVWLLFVMAAIGLRLTSRHQIPSKA
ncbi:MAG: O-antigen ligase [Rhizobiaceae bacterium]